jgi:hypothetical protein
VKATANSTRPGGRGGIGAVELIGTANIDGNWYKEVTPPPSIQGPSPHAHPCTSNKSRIKEYVYAGGTKCEQKRGIEFSCSNHLSLPSNSVREKDEKKGIIPSKIGDCVPLDWCK